MRPNFFFIGFFKVTFNGDYEFHVAPGKFVLLYCTIRVLFVNTYLELAKRD